MVRRVAFLAVLALALGQAPAWAETSRVGSRRALLAAHLRGRALEPSQGSNITDINDPDALIAQGLKAMRKGDYQSALDAFRRAHQTRPTTRSHTEIGLAEQALHLWVEAEADLAGALAEKGDAWLEAHRSLIEKAMADVRSHLGILSVETGPRGAEVKIDGKVRGLLPLPEPIFLSPGVATVEITAPERRLWRQDAQIKPGETTRLAPIFEPLDLPAAGPAVVAPASQPERLRGAEPPALRVIGWLGLVSGSAAAASGGYLLAGSNAGSSRRLAGLECLALGSAAALSGGLIIMITGWHGSVGGEKPGSTGLSLAGRF